MVEVNLTRLRKNPVRRRNRPDHEKLLVLASLALVASCGSIHADVMRREGRVKMAKEPGSFWGVLEETSEKNASSVFLANVE